MNWYVWNVWMSIPFIVILGCIAVLPLVAEHWWEENINKLKIALGLGIPTALVCIVMGRGFDIIHSVVEFYQFISLLGALFVVSGGICIVVNLRATPWNNALFLITGILLASWMGTTGAAMLFIRPLLQTNQERNRVKHTVVFFIICVANCGGLLTPLGDPPLFMGMLRGVPFSWTFSLFREWLFVNSLIVIVFLAIDMWQYSKEEKEAIEEDMKRHTPFSLTGGLVNFPLLGTIVATVILIPSVNMDAIHHGKAVWHNYIPARELVFAAIMFASWRFTPQKVRKDNEFSFHAIQEVAYLFSGIFLCMVPALITVKQLAPSLPMDKHTFFAFTGSLSAFLDNAPTYLVFFDLAKQIGGPGQVAGVPEIFLRSISLGAVFFGAFTYIGNGPNFMTKAIADERGIKMPSFVGYLLQALFILGPVVAAMYMLFIAKGGLMIPGYALTSTLVAGSVLVFAFYFKKSLDKGYIFKPAE